ncbi:DUF3078 domain-containing protein [Pontimicrobium aquaticum]|uniref:DUF3078 domain-containing protein n=1 Tax=Pontimicrobium aquaticum TaxID=2565367 RepID=A0A4U0F0Y7_9FLAO|nr:DUF3078 domain-containing protein [Pontimicrobium aquaticum]TJY38091.1 DUF3078 domain-containing protein [Pontimicrobium aquaticum]
MRKLLLAITIVFGMTSLHAQEADETPKDGWTKTGTISFLLNQSSFDNWVAGGQSNLSGTLGLNYDFNLLKGDWTWDNKLIAAFGITKIKGEDAQKSDDRLEWNSLLGKKASGYWYYSAFFNFKTQFADDLDSDTDGPTKFLSPAYLQFGPGMLWKKSDNLKVNIAPATSKLVIVDKDLTLPNEAYFGVEEGKSTRFEFGAALGAYYKVNLMENVSMENILNLYSNYLEDPQNVDLDYTMNLVMTINKYLSANLAFQTIYDDNAFEGFQTRQVFGLGINYGF